MLSTLTENNVLVKEKSWKINKDNIDNDYLFEEKFEKKLARLKMLKKSQSQFLQI